jgi:hypothetical protein
MLYNLSLLHFGHLAPANLAMYIYQLMFSTISAASQPAAQHMRWPGLTHVKTRGFFPAELLLIFDT